MSPIRGGDECIVVNLHVSEMIHDTYDLLDKLIKGLFMFQAIFTSKNNT